MLKNIIIAVLLTFVSIELSAQLVINEINQGPGGNPPNEYVEFVVMGTKTCTDSCLNIQNWILDDNNGFFGSNGIAGGHIKFNSDPQWQCVPFGTVIVIYNSLNPFTGIVIDETDANNDNVYFLPSNSTFFESDLTTPIGGTPSASYAGSSYSSTGAAWDVLGMQNGNDVFQTVAPSDLTSSYHSVGWGSSTGMDIAFSGSASGLLFQNENITDNNPYTQTNWASQSESAGTPGVGNSVANIAWINSMNTITFVYDTISETICNSDSVLFNGNYYNLLGNYIDTISCDTIRTLNLNVQVCTNCSMDLGPDELFCGPVNMLLDAGMFDEYLWQDGSTNQTFNVTSSGQYYCQGINYDPTNLVVNGDFESGNVNFSTDYVAGTGGSWGLLSNPGTYAITTSPSLVHNNFHTCSDHTSGSGNMLVVNGASVANTSVWCQTIPVSQNTDYYFSLWALSTENANSTNVSQLQFEVNGVQLGNIFTAPFTSCTWQSYTETWNSGTSTSITLCIQNQNTQGGGNDFALDDIFFGESCIVSDTINVLGQTNLMDSSSIEICFGESALIFGNNETQEGLYLDTISTLAGCDSLYLKRYLNVGIDLSTTSNQTICFGDSVFLENAWQKTSNTYYDTLQSSTMCDSLIITNLTVSVAPTSDTTTVCSNDVADVGIKIDTVFNVAGCPINFNILETVRVLSLPYNLDPLFVCEGDSVEIFGNMETEANVYADTVRSVLGCDSIVKSQTLIVNAYPIVDAGNDVSIDAGNSVTLIATGGASYVWSTGDDTSFISVSPQSTTTYSVEGDLNGCNSFDTVTVFVINEEVEILIPNAFTPNADNINDVFKIANEDDFENISMRVYNRWGEMVFSSSNELTVWDGTYNEIDQAEDSYTYFIKATSKTTQKHFEVSSTVALIR